MKIQQLAAQLYTVRDLCRTPAETAATLQAIRAIGYTAVEVAGIPCDSSAQLAEMIRDAGLTACAFHGRPDAVLDEPEKIVADSEAFSSPFIVYSYPSGFDLGRAEDVRRLTDKLSAAAAAYHQSGKTLCYHHHSLEFARHGSATVLDHIVDTTNPAHLSIELDTYWVQHGGGTPDRWCRRLAGRLPILHLKDFGCIGGTPTMMETGRGNLDWSRILPAAESAGCTWFVVEQDRSVRRAPLEDAELSIGTLKKIGLK